MWGRTSNLIAPLGALMLLAGMALAGGYHSSDDAFCMEVNIEPFHMVPGYTDPAGACAVRDYWDGELQEAFYPFTRDEHLFNCEYFGDVAPLPTGGMVPASVVSEGEITGTIAGHPFSARLYCASLTNWYQDSCSDDSDPSTCGFQLAQPFLGKGLPFPRVTEVSLFDGVVKVKRHRKTIEIPLVLATRAAGITHLEDMTTDPPQVGASVTHSALGMVTYKHRRRHAEVLGGSMDLLLQGHIFSPKPVEEDEGAAVIRGTICSEDLYGLLNKRGRWKWWGSSKR